MLNCDHRQSSAGNASYLTAPFNTGDFSGAMRDIVGLACEVYEYKSPQGQNYDNYENVRTTNGPVFNLDAFLQKGRIA